MLSRGPLLSWAALTVVAALHVCAADHLSSDLRERHRPALETRVLSSKEDV